MTHLAQTPVDTNSSGAATPTLTPSSGSNRVWLLGVSHEQSNLTTWMNAFTVGGQTPTLFDRASHGSTTNNTYAEFYYLLESQVAALSADPAFSCGTPGNDYFGVTVFELSGRDQTPANWTWNSNGSDTITAATFSLTTGTDIDVCAILSCTSGASGGSFSAGVTEITGTDRAFNGTNSRTLAGTVTTSTDPLTVTGDISSSSGSTFQLLAAVGVPPATSVPTISSTSDDTPTNGSTLTLTVTNAEASQGTGGVTANGVGWTETSWSDTSVAATVALGDNKYGVNVPLVLTNNSGQSSSAYNVQIQPASGVSYVNLSGTLASSGDRITATPDLSSGDQLEISNVQGGTISDVTVNVDASFNVAVGVTSFDVRVNDGTGWGDIGTQYIEGLSIESSGLCRPIYSTIYRNIYKPIGNE